MDPLADHQTVENTILSLTEMSAIIAADDARMDSIGRQSIQPITRVEIKITPSRYSTRPCAAVVYLASGDVESPRICVCAHELMDLYRAVAVRDADYPTTIILSFRFGSQELQFSAPPRLARQLARLRIWSDYLMRAEFELEDGCASLPITIA